VRLALAPDERRLYEDVSALVRARMSEPDSLAQAHRFTLQTLQREIGSWYAARTFEKLRPLLQELWEHTTRWELGGRLPAEAAEG
jgi:hypothetical protein